MNSTTAESTKAPKTETAEAAILIVEVPALGAADQPTVVEPLFLDVTLHKRQRRSDSDDSGEEQLEKDNKLIGAIKINKKKLSAEQRIEKITEALNQGANINLQDGRRKHNTPLHLAVKIKNNEKKLLEKDVPVDAQTTDNWTPLHLAAGNGHLEVVKELLEKGAPVDELATDNWTPLHLAAGNGYLEVVKELLEKGAPVDELATDNVTPLHLAAQNGHLEVVQALLEKGAPGDAQSKGNWTSLHLAAQNGHLEVVQALLEKDAPADAQTTDNVTPLHLAAQNGHLEV
ncbi:MAG TPA: ankyrin repeat domain-containing protein, partial [Amoebophilaceae bacterium]|nr:ankyrin repeat domain-containing protein [Amoebophilaceae bacterium]